MSVNDNAIGLINSSIDTYVHEEPLAAKRDMLKRFILKYGDADTVDTRLALRKVSFENAARLYGSYMLFCVYFRVLYAVTMDSDCYTNQNEASIMTLFSDIVSVIMYDLITGMSFDIHFRERMLRQINTLLLTGLDSLLKGLLPSNADQNTVEYLDTLFESYINVINSLLHEYSY